jgi:DNA-binding transcriptional ArsR family regulator
MKATAAQLDAAFQALGNATRRAVVEHLRRGPASVSELAEPFAMALPSFLQHVQMLEAAGLVRSEKRGRVRTVHLRPERLAPAVQWLEEQRALWSRRLDQLDAHVREMEKSR